MKLSDYLLVTNADQFNAEIKSSAKDKYIQSSIYAGKGEKKQLIEDYREKQREAAKTAFKFDSLNDGLLAFCVNFI